MGCALRDRSCARREARGRMGFRAVREGGVDRFQCLLRPDPAAASRLSGGSENLGTGSQKVNRGPPGVGPTYLHKRGHSYLFSGNEGQAPNGMVLVRCRVVLRGIGPARAGKLGGGWGFRAVREGRGLIASNACSGPFPLPLGGSVVGLALGVSRGRPGVGPAHLHKRGHSDLF